MAQFSFEFLLPGEAEEFHIHRLSFFCEEVKCDERFSYDADLGSP